MVVYGGRENGLKNTLKQAFFYHNAFERKPNQPWLVFM